MHQPGGSRLEAAGTEVEPAQVVLEINVEPLATRLCSAHDRQADKLRADSLALVVGSNLRIEHEGVAGRGPPVVATGLSR